MDVLGCFLAPRDIEVAATRGTRSDEDCVPVLAQQRLHAVDARAGTELDAKVENVAAFFVDDGIRQAEFWNLRADHAARFRILVEDHAMVAKRGKIAGDGERGRAAADQGYAFAIFLGCRLWQTVTNVVFVVGRDSFQAANSHRLLLYACAPARWLAGAVARATEDSRETHSSAS